MGFSNDAMSSNRMMKFRVLGQVPHHIYLVHTSKHNKQVTTVSTGTEKSTNTRNTTQDSEAVIISIGNRLMIAQYFLVQLKKTTTKA